MISIFSMNTHAHTHTETVTANICNCTFYIFDYIHCGHLVHEKNNIPASAAAGRL